MIFLTILSRPVVIAAKLNVTVIIDNGKNLVGLCHMKRFFKLNSSCKATKLQRDKILVVQLMQNVWKQTHDQNYKTTWIWILKDPWTCLQHVLNTLKTKTEHCNYVKSAKKNHWESLISAKNWNKLMDFWHALTINLQTKVIIKLGAWPVNDVVFGMRLDAVNDLVPISMRHAW